MRIKKAVFPVAGLGTRFLPATKAMPKEMLPVVDKPLIQYAVEEAVAAGVEMMVFVTGRNKRAIADHFDKAYELESELERNHKAEMLEQVRSIVPSHVSCVYLRQTEALGLGHAVLCAQPVIGNDPFAVILADDLIDNVSNPCLEQMVSVFSQKHSSVLGVEKVNPSETNRYGIVSVSEPLEQGLGKVSFIVEKPKPAEAPSNMAVVGRYILTPKIFDYLSTTAPGAGGEIQLTDAIESLLKDEDVFAYQFKGKRYDCGSKIGYLMANVEHALMHDELGAEFKQYLEHICLG